MHSVIIESLHKLSQNLWWSWNSDAHEIFHELSPQVWNFTNRNPVAILSAISPAELHARLLDQAFVTRVKTVLDKFEFYVNEEASVYKEFSNHPIAYFSPEFALHECLPIYSGGLGVLSGDHIKSASDLNLPLVGIGLFYRQGYFSQQLTLDGTQEERYHLNEPDRLPMELVRYPSGKPMVILVEIGHSLVHLNVWKIKVGRISLYLLDSNHPNNEEHYRDLTSRTYGGDITTRICQEMVMGIGGVRALTALGISPSVYHMNEGHSAFLTFELLYNKISEGVSIEEAEVWIRQHSVFTTHTPVPAGHDRFTEELLNFSMNNYSALIGIPVEKLMNYGRVEKDNKKETFCMTVLALKMSLKSNAVSELHGSVSRTMWKPLYPDFDEKHIPITHITNGVHLETWLHPRGANFWKNHLGEQWTQEIRKEDFWKKLLDPQFISDEAIWAMRYELRRTLIEFVRTRLFEQQRRLGGNNFNMYANLFSPDALTIGFARRFATYKRAPMILEQIDRITKIANDQERPVQIIFSGKAHPRDEYGKAFIKRIVAISRDPKLFGRVAFLENYDMGVARYLIAGCDVWLNNPRRPQEASGTSGQKITIHGGLNFSILDGWWREGYDGKNGFAIGKDESSNDEAAQDTLDLDNLYTTLETKVLPKFYNRDVQGIPRAWIMTIRHAMASLLPVFNTDRMVRDYVEKLYRKK